MANSSDGGEAEERGGLSGQLALIADMSRDFAQSLDLDDTLRRAMARIRDHVGAEGGALFLLDDEGTKLTCHACVGESDITGLELGADQGIVGRSVQAGTPAIIRDVANDPDFHDAFDDQSGFTTRSILCAPMSVKEQKLGAIELVNKKDGDHLFSESDLHVLQVLASSAALAILNARMAEALVEQERVKREIELAAEIQRSLLPEDRDDAFPVHGRNVPARTVSGDFFDFFTLDDGRVCFNLGDVSGKGMNAALLMAKTASIYRCLGKTIHDPGKLLALVNAELCETVTRGMFVTMVGGIYDPRTGVVRLANAGHEPPLFFDTDGNVTAFEAEAPPLGISDLLVGEHDFPETEVTLAGGTLYIFTDGVTEGYLDDAGTMLEADGLKAILSENATEAVSTRLGAVVGRLNRDGVVLHDDITIVAVQDRREEPAVVEGGAIPVSGDPTLAVQGERLLKVSFPSKPDRLRLSRSAVKETARVHGFDDEAVHDVILAVDEACQNVIRHAYGHSPDGIIDLEIRRDGDALIILLHDHADPVDVSKIKPRDLDDVRPGGLGTHLMQEVMDEVMFLPSPPEGGNLLRMMKKRV